MEDDATNSVCNFQWNLIFQMEIEAQFFSMFIYLFW